MAGHTERIIRDEALKELLKERYSELSEKVKRMDNKRITQKDVDEAQRLWDQRKAKEDEERNREITNEFIDELVSRSVEYRERREELKRQEERMAKELNSLRVLARETGEHIDRMNKFQQQRFRTRLNKALQGKGFVPVNW